MNTPTTIYFDAPIAHFSAQSPEQASLATQMNGQINQPRPRIPSHDSIGWLPAVDRPAESSAEMPARRSSILRRNSPTRPGSASPSRSTETRNGAVGTANEANDAKPSASVRREGSISRRSVFTNVDIRPTSPFIHGAATTATAAPDEELVSRAASADTALTPSQKSRINKLEAKEAKRLSRIIRDEGSVEKKALNLAIDELAELQNLQRKVIKDEAKAHSVHAKLLDTVRKYEVEYMDAKARYEATLARLFAEEQVLEKFKEHARDATEQMRAKAEEVDRLRAVFSVDERERELRVMQLTGKNSRSSFWR